MAVRSASPEPLVLCTHHQIVRASLSCNIVVPRETRYQI